MSKIICTGDWHMGRDNDSRKHNDYLMEFIDFMVDYAVKNEIEAIFQLGDYFDNRSKVSIETLNYAITGAKKIRNNFGGGFYVFTGNHDMFYKNRLDVNSTVCLESSAELVASKRIYKTSSGERILMCPWVCDGEQWDTIVNESRNCDYVFGHFEFRNFMMNENYVMEHGLSHRELKDVKRVITGHYHMRQEKDNVIYTGSPFPFDYNDANDFDRGFVVLDTKTNEIEYVNWNKVKILSVTYEEFLEYKAEGLIDEHCSVRVELPDDASDTMIEEATAEVSSLPTNASKINYKGNKAKELMESDVEIKEVDNVDQTIVDAIRGINEPPSDVNIESLVNIYEKAKELTA